MALFGNKEEKIALKIEEHIKEGNNHLKKKMYNGALVEFSKAMDLNANTAYPKLLEIMDASADSGEYESALSIGLNLIKGKRNDYKLVNKLGNYARKQGDFKQANSLYKTAYKINKKFKIAFYNLAASEVKADFYDDANLQALEQFKEIKDFFLPTYAGGESFIKGFEKKVKENKSKAIASKLQHLMNSYEQKKQSGDLVEAKEIELEIEKLKKRGEGSIDDVCRAFEKQIEGGTSFTDIQKYDFSIYSIKNKRADFAAKLLQDISEEEFPFVHLLQATILAMQGKTEAALDRFMKLLGEDTFNRYYNINLGFLYRKMGKSFLSIKYLLKTAELLKRTDGIFSIQEVIKMADEEVEKGNPKKALEFYLIAVQEISDPNLWNKIGELQRELKQIDKAIKSFKEILKIDPKSELANAQLRKIHDYFVSQGNNLMNENKNQPAADFYERALFVMRLAETLKKAAEAYHRMNNIKQEKKLLLELEAIENEIKAKEQERLRQALMMKGKQLMRQKKYQKAIEVFDAAFDLKLDKGLYAQLAKLYITFKGKDSVNALAKRWEDMIVKKERDDMMAREKEKEREAKEEAEENQEKEQVQKENE